MTSSIRNARNVLAVSFFICSKVFASGQAEGRVQSGEKANSVAAVVVSPYRFLWPDQDKTWQILQIDTRKTSPGNFTSTTSVSTAICAVRPRRQISSATMTVDIPTFTNKQRIRRKKRAAKKRWKVARSKPSATTARFSSVANALLKADFSFRL